MGGVNAPPSFKGYVSVNRKDSRVWAGRTADNMKKEG